MAAADAALDAIGALADPVRRALYRFVAAAGAPVGRGEAAEAVGVQRTLAAHHLDRLVEAGLLETSFARPEGRRGPGAGRPAKLYARARDAEASVSVPPRAYDTAGLVLAGALDLLRADAAVAASAREEGRLVGEAYRSPGSGAAAEGGTGAGGSVEAQRVRVLRALREQGYEPYDDPADKADLAGGLADGGSDAATALGATPGGDAGSDAGSVGVRGRILLRNCPFHRLAAQFPPLVCGMNLALLDGVLEGAGATGWRARMDAAAGRCCVALEPADD
ncbi:helix-turn-helix domain-containing protein [Yinghuangia seranimata]|nr:helix-turn-helix domain-containing protein [Yinghuangia seranimata]MDI2129149.1 helix-turn-helix domain-containing protein [Yinghuangia seranimata]